MIAELLELIANGENSGVEFKRDDLRPEQIAREVVALANFRGGRLLLGVEDDGTISGVRRDGLERWVMDTVFGRYVHPMIKPFYEEVRIDERRVAVVTVTEGTAKPYVVRHRGQEQVYVRMGSASQLASRDQRMGLFSAGSMLYAESLPVSGSGLRALSKERLADYLTTVLGLTDLPATNAEWNERLCDLGFMVENPGRSAVCTIAGLVLFGYRPRRLMRQAGVRWMAFKGEDRACDALDDQVIDGPLVALWREQSGGGRELVEKGLIERLAGAMRPFITEEAGEVDESMSRQRRWHYPFEAVREAVVNSVTHRDWTRYEEIAVVRYADRMEILSPGALPNFMSVQKMLAGRRSPRNLLISDVMRDYGYADARGMGVRNKIVPLLQARNGVAPEFDADEDHLKLTMRRGPEDARR